MDFLNFFQWCAYLEEFGTFVGWDGAISLNLLEDKELGWDVGEKSLSSSRNSATSGDGPRLPSSSEWSLKPEGLDDRAPPDSCHLSCQPPPLE